MILFIYLSHSIKYTLKQNGVNKTHNYLVSVGTDKLDRDAYSAAAYTSSRIVRKKDHA